MVISCPATRNKATGCTLGCKGHNIHRWSYTNSAGALRSVLLNQWVVIQMGTWTQRLIIIKRYSDKQSPFSRLFLPILARAICSFWVHYDSQECQKEFQQLDTNESFMFHMKNKNNKLSHGGVLEPQHLSKIILHFCFKHFLRRNRQKSYITSIKIILLRPTCFRIFILFFT